MDSVVLETSLGDVQLELYWEHAPRVSQLPIPSVTDPLHSPTDVQELCRTGATRVLQWCRISSRYCRMSDFDSPEPILIPYYRTGFHDSRR